MSTALLLGAGASRELGMPLRHELNAEIAAWMTPTSVRAINSARRNRGYGHSDEAIATLVSALESSDFDYETLLRDWESRFIAGAEDGTGASYHGLYAWLAQVVSLILFRRQVSNRDAFRDGLPYFDGLLPLARDNAPLWVFSLNHDVLVECIAAHFGIPLSCGFPNRSVNIPCRAGTGDVVAHLQAQWLTDAEMADAALSFLPQGSPGINLLKIHGALDIFGFGEGQDLIKLMPAEQSFDAIIDALQIANEGLLEAGLSPEPMSVVNQIPYIDETGVMRVLRRTLLASATRVTDPFPLLLQRRFLEYFRINLGRIDRLVSIGYGMADADVNEILLEWLTGSRERQLEIVVPLIRRVPPFLAPAAAQITLVPSSTSTYLERFT